MPKDAWKGTKLSPLWCISNTSYSFMLCYLSHIEEPRENVGQQLSSPRHKFSIAASHTIHACTEQDSVTSGTFPTSLKIGTGIHEAKNWYDQCLEKLSRCKIEFPNHASLRGCVSLHSAASSAWTLGMPLHCHCYKAVFFYFQVWGLHFKLIISFSVLHFWKMSVVQMKCLLFLSPLPHCFDLEN